MPHSHELAVYKEILHLCFSGLQVVERPSSVGQVANHLCEAHCNPGFEKRYINKTLLTEKGFF